MNQLINLFGDNSKALRTDISLLLLRIMAGGAMITHGYPKFQRLTGGEEIRFMEFLGMSAELSLGLVVFAELFCSILLVIGLFTRLSAIPLIVTMLVAVMVVHGADPFNDKELGLLYLFPYVVLFLMGAGKFSVDNLLTKKA